MELNNLEYILSLMDGYQNTLHNEMIKSCTTRRDFTRDLQTHIVKNVIAEDDRFFYKSINIEASSDWSGIYQITKKPNGKYAKFVEISIFNYFGAHWLVNVGNLFFVSYDEKNAKEMFNNIILSDNFSEDYLLSMGFFY